MDRTVAYLSQNQLAGIGIIIRIFIDGFTGLKDFADFRRGNFPLKHPLNGMTAKHQFFTFQMLKPSSGF